VGAMTADANENDADVVESADDGLEAVADDAKPVEATAAEETSGGEWSNVRRYVEYAVLGALGVVGLIALVQLYFSASSAISTWITPEYRSLFRAGFNLVVLLLVGAGISWRLRRMDARDAGE
ncbi:MAG: hypothetical protein ABEJ28_07320, partial [Salinigranum sp.]